MGYGVGHEVKLHCQSGYAKYNGKNLVITDVKIDSWDLTHPMDGMTDIRPDLLKIKFNSIPLSQDERNWLKNNGVKRGDESYFSWDKNPSGYLWSGYVRSPLDVAFPIDLVGTIDVDFIGCVEVVVTTNMKNKKIFASFIKNVLDYFPDDKACLEYIDESGDEDMSIDEARDILYNLNKEDNDADYGA